MDVRGECRRIHHVITNRRLCAAASARHRRAWRRCNNGLAGVGLVSLVALSVVCGMAVLAPGARQPLLWQRWRLWRPASVVNAAHLRPALVLLLLALWMRRERPAQEPPRGEPMAMMEALGKWGGNWDIDVGLAELAVEDIASAAGGAAAAAVATAPAQEPG